MASDALVTDMLCICSVNHATGYQACGATITAGTGDLSTKSGSKAKAFARWELVSTACAGLTKGMHETLSPSAIAEALANFYSGLGANWLAQAAISDYNTNNAQRNTIYGVHALAGGTKADCSSDNNPLSAGGKGVCIKYAKTLQENKEISWVKHMRNAAKELQAASDIFKQQTTFIAKIKAIEHQMTSLLLMGGLFAATKNQPLTAIPTKQPTQKEQIKCKNPPNKTAEGCAATDCDYDDTVKECKPKTGTGDSTAGTETRTGGARHGTDKASCENDKADDKQNCAWRKDKNNEDEKDTEKCRDSSFLVNKKLDLSMGATFMSLLFS
uniref:Variant surface glycoprotein 1125.5349 n=1 Tax=Trypanosoma brucei TaxID=5691 RepID=A0A1J0RC52_9TRYP|nr:variant surface glycoprotein 1125.5349 [Trypanosoma brucei]